MAAERKSQSTPSTDGANQSPALVAPSASPATTEAGTAPTATEPTPSAAPAVMPGTTEPPVAPSPSAPIPTEPVAAVDAEYVVAPGVSVFGTAAGVVEAGQPITPAHFQAQERFDELVARGTIVRRP